MILVKSWRSIPQRYRYEAAKCEKCGKVHFPPRLICAECGHKKFEDYTLPTEGKVITWTIIRTPPKPFADEAPYAMAIIELADGVRLTTQVVDLNLEDLKAGMPVQLEFRRIQEEGHHGVLAYAYKAVPKIG